MTACVRTPAVTAMMCGMPDPAAGRVTLVLADDHAVVRSGLRLLLEAEDGPRGRGRGRRPPTTPLRYARAHRPDVLVLDLNMPGAPSLEVIPEIRAQVAADRDRRAHDAGGSGASRARRCAPARCGYVLKEAADEELLQAVRLAAAGDTYLNPRLGARLAAEPPAPSGRPTT